MVVKKHWQSFGELTGSDSFKASSEKEFAEELPQEGIDSKGILDLKSPRRDFLKYLGFSTAAAALAASCEIPVKKAIPYLNKPENMAPGVADYYATTYTSGGDVVPILAKVRDGRPIKIEGNELSSLTKGGTSARVQASVLDLYDTARLRFPVQMTSNGPQQITSFDAFDKMIAGAMGSLGGAPVVILTSSITSPTTRQIISEFLAKNAGSRHVQYDADSFSGMMLANEACYGKKAIPAYQFDNAKVIVSLGADFLGTWLTPVEFARQYSKGRKIDEKNPEMSMHYQFESMLSTTGGSADERFVHRPTETGAVALALLAAVGGNATAPALGDKLKFGVNEAAKSLLGNKGKGLVVSGSNDVHVQTVVNSINEMIGANGSTVNWGTTVQTRQGIDSDFESLVADLNAGKVGALLVYGVNPVYTHYAADKFKAGLQKTKLTVSFNDRIDETTELCKYAIPAPHFLESWGDAEGKTGYFSLMQPTIAPLFLTRPFEDSLLRWSGNNTEYENYFKQYWTGKLGAVEAYQKALQDGVIEPSVPSAGGATYNGGKLAESVAALSSRKIGTGLELVIYQKISMGVGYQANNPWLLELPDPITKATWDNYAIVSPEYAKKTWNLDLANRRQADKYEVYPEKKVVSINAGGKKLELPVLIFPGIHNDVVAVAVGFGRQSAAQDKTQDKTRDYIGRAVVGAGVNAFPLTSYNGTTIDWFVPDITIDQTDKTYSVAQTQTHSSYEGRDEVVKEMTLEDFKKSPQEILDERAKALKPFGGLENFEKEGTLFPYYDKPGIHWGMSIDLNSCIGCGACAIACHAENNVPVVGKSEVMRFHDMHWMRIDRYFSGDPMDPDSVQTVFMPMLCQHCDNAPCENVCPVSATNHSSEGLNQMAYNRCIGTKYCANNCPYKVRRFNWADYTGADSFPDNQVFTGVGKLDDSVIMMNDDLTRMVLNPDVVVRARGVMEKCSFCVQRLQEGKLKAKKENRPLKDMEDVRTACQQACPTEAIVFGNVNDGTSRIRQMREGNPERLYYALEDLHVIPNVNYLAKIRNTEKISDSITES